MKVSIASITQPLVEGISTPDEFIVYCARVSNPDNQLNTATGPRLLRYCIKHGHWSIFEQASMTIEVETSLAIAEQIVRHCSMRFQKFSLRYSEAETIEPIEIRRAAKSNRQSSEDIHPNAAALNKRVDHVMKQVFRLYKDMIEQGVARECARMILPQATTTRLYVTGNVRSWIHYLQQRLSEHAQKEHRLVAKEVEQIFAKHFPQVYEAIKQNEADRSDLS